jgi:hypothetical protein
MWAIRARGTLKSSASNGESMRHCLRALHVVMVMICSSAIKHTLVRRILGSRYYARRHWSDRETITQSSSSVRLVTSVGRYLCVAPMTETEAKNFTVHVTERVMHQKIVVTSTAFPIPEPHVGHGQLGSTPRIPPFFQIMSDNQTVNHPGARRHVAGAAPSPTVSALPTAGHRVFTSDAQSRISF